MSQLSRHFKVAATSVAAAFMLAACGGGAVDPGDDMVAPTVVITDSVAAAVATGSVTFTFTFSEPVGSSFVTGDVTVTGGTKGAFTMAADARSATLVVTPTASATGTLLVQVAAGAFADAAGNVSTVAFTGSQDYDTTGAPSGGTVLTNFDDVLPVGDLGQFGDAAASIAEAPGGESGAALKLDRSGAQNFGGTFYAVTPAIPFAADRKTITARVRATRANAVIFLKVEAAGGAATEVAATVTAANTWQTLTWNLAGVNPANSYGTVVFSADTDVAIGGAQTYWVDDVTLAGEAAPPPPSMGGTLLSNFDDVLPVGDLGQFGDAGASIAEAPGGESGAALKLDRSGALNFGGTFYAVAPAIPFEANRKTISARVFATRANAVIFLKVEAPGGVATEVRATVTAANTWQTLTWNLAGVNPANSYATVVFSADTDVAIGGAQTYWVDDVTLLAGGGGGVAPTVLTYSSGFASFDRTIEGGQHGGFSGSNQDNFACTFDPAICGNGGGFTTGENPVATAADSFFFNYYQTAIPATALYSGIFVQAPGVVGLNDGGDTPGITITNQTRMNITVGQNPEWFRSATNNFLISMDLGKFYTLGSGGGCRLQVRAVVTPTAAEALYTVPLSAFALVQNCGGVASTAAQAFAQSPISQINVQANGGTIALDAGGKSSGANLTVPNAEGLYPTTVLIKGAITFD